MVDDIKNNHKIMLNQNAGYGRATFDVSHILANLLPTARLFIVGDSATARRDVLDEIFKPSEGQVRIYTTINKAVRQCTATTGDTILVMPGHTENISSATALALDIADINIIGLGTGTSRPTLTLDTGATSTIAVSAANITIKNIIFSANYADIASVFTLTTAKNFNLVDCLFKDTATNMNFLTIVTTSTVDNAADGLTFSGCQWITPDLATSTLATIKADLDSFVVKGCYLNLGVNTNDLPALAIVSTGKDLTNAQIGGVNKSEGNVIIRLNDANPLLITADTTTANTGFVANNFVRHADTSGELLVTADTKFGYFENKATAVDNASGFILPAVDS
jgi:hypothetical protein